MKCETTGWIIGMWKGWQKNRLINSKKKYHKNTNVGNHNNTNLPFKIPGHGEKVEWNGCNQMHVQIHVVHMYKINIFFLSGW